MHKRERFSLQPAAPRGVGPRLAWVALAVVLGALCLLAARAAISHQSPFSEYLSQARRCVELNDCPSRGGRTGALPLFHGASWIRLLSQSLRAGYDLTHVQSIVLESWMLALALTFFVLQRYLGLRAAALGVGLYFPVVLIGTDITDLTYTNLLPLPWALYYACLALFIEYRRLVFGVAASVALAAAVSLELGGIVMVPFHLLVVALMTPTPLVSVVVYGLAVALPFGLESTDAAREILRQVPTMRFAIALAISAGAVVLGVRLWPRASLQTPRPIAERVRAAMASAVIFSTIAIWLVVLVLMRGVPAPRYLTPASFPFLYLVAAGLGALDWRGMIVVGGLEGLASLLLAFAHQGFEVLQVPIAIVMTVYAFAALRRALGRGGGRWPGGLWPALTVCACAIAVSAGATVLAAKRGSAQALTLADVEQLVPRLYAAGYSYPELLATLHGAAADDLLALLTERDPQLFTAPHATLTAHDFSLMVVKVPNSAIPRTQGVIAAATVGSSTSAIVVRGERSYLDWLHMRRCGRVFDQWRGVLNGCSAPRTDRPLPRNWPYVEFGDPLPTSARDHGDDASSRTIRFEVPVHTPGRKETHIVRTANEWPATWQIVRVDGVEFEGGLPAAEIRLPDRREASGVVEFEFQPALSPELPWVWIPHVVEVSERNEHLLEPLRGQS